MNENKSGLEDLIKGMKEAEYLNQTDMLWVENHIKDFIEQSQNPTAPAGLIKELKVYLENFTEVGICSIAVVPIDGLEEIVSRYEPQESLDKNKTPLQEVRVQCPHCRVFFHELVTKYRRRKALRSWRIGKE